MSAEIGQIRQFFALKQLRFDNEWLESCVDWCKTNDLAANHTFEQLRDTVYQQWLIFDLRQVQVPILPPNLAHERNYLLQGIYYLQIIQIVDISKPKLHQIQQIRNMHLATNQELGAGDSALNAKRMLQFTLSDGVQQVEAMEYQNLGEFHINLAPGSKVKLTGPLQVRRGRIMLKPDQFTLLGGEVDELLVPNAPENVLARALNLPENPNPLGIPEEPQNTRAWENSPIHDRSTQIVGNPQTNANLMDADDELYANLDVDSLIRNSNPVANPPQPIGFEDDDDDFLASMDLDAHLDQLEMTNASQSSESSIIPLSKLKERLNIKFGLFKVRAKFKRVTEKLTLSSGYKLRIEIEDDSGDLNVDIHSDLLETFAGCSHATVMELREQFMADDPVAVKQLKQILEQLRETLTNLEGVMEVRIEENTTPIVINVL